MEVPPLPLLTQQRHHPDEARAAGRSAIPCYPTPIDFIEEARPLPRRVLRSPSGGPSTSSGPCAIFKRSGLAVECPRVAQMSGPAGVGRRIARYGILLVAGPYFGCEFHA